jgi:hypothetical protein
MAPGTEWEDMENLTPTGVRTPDRQARNETLHRLRYAGSRDGNPAAHSRRHRILTSHAFSNFQHHF